MFAAEALPLFPPSRRPKLSNHITLFASGKGRRSETVGAKLGALPGPKGPQVGPTVRFMAFAIFLSGAGAPAPAPVHRSPASGNERYLQVDLECVLSQLTWRGLGSSHVSAPLSALVRRGACQSERGALGMHRGICSIQAHRNNSAGWVRPNGLGERLAMQPDPQIHGLCGRRLRSRRFRQDGRNRRELHRPGHAA
jgi:hypothetical protein